MADLEEPIQGSIFNLSHEGGLRNTEVNATVPESACPPLPDKTQDCEEDLFLGLSMGRVVAGALLILLIATAVAGNILVCIAISTDRTLRKLSNLFFISLAISDLLMASIVMPFALVNDLTDTWMFGNDFCKLWIATDVMSSTASILNLLAISLDRYVHIKDPLQYTEWITRKSVPLTISATWIVSAAISFLPISLDLHQRATNDSYSDVIGHNLTLENDNGFLTK